MTSKVDICNKALGVLGVTHIQSLTSTNDKNVAACNTYYDSTRRTAIRRHMWSFAKRREAIAEVTNTSDQWAFKYKYPVDALRVFKLDDTGGTYDGQTVKFEIIAEATGKFIYTNLEAAYAFYVVDVDDPNKYDADFEVALYTMLAEAMYGLVKGTVLDIDYVTRKAALALNAARAADGDETVQVFDPVPDWISEVYVSGGNSNGITVI